MLIICKTLNIFFQFFDHDERNENDNDEIVM
jgi:hypothetical protein